MKLSKNSRSFQHIKYFFPVEPGRRKKLLLVLIQSNRPCHIGLQTSSSYRGVLLRSCYLGLVRTASSAAFFPRILSRLDAGKRSRDLYLWLIPRLVRLFLSWGLQSTIECSYNARLNAVSRDDLVWFKASESGVEKEFVTITSTLHS